MEAERCRNCDALLADGADWCNQCFTPIALAELPTAPPESQPESPAPERSIEQINPAEPFIGLHVADEGKGEGEIDPRLVWACPTCGEENPLTLTLCVVCGTPFGKLFDEQKKVEMDPSRAAALGLLPGYAMIKMGAMIEGLSRAIAAILTVVTVFFFIGPGGGVARIIILALYVFFMVFLVVESSASSRMLAENRGVLVSGRFVMYGFSGVFGASLVLLIMVATTARRQ